MTTPEIVLHPEISKWRRTSEDEALRKDLKETGQLQNMIFRRLPDGKLQLLAGNSRYHELTKLGVPFEQWDMKVLENVSEQDAVLIAMSENRFRRKLSAVEEGRMFRSMQKLKMPIEEITLRYRCSETYVRDRLQLLDLPEKIQDMMEEGTIPMSYAKPINRLAGNEKAQTELVQKIKKGQDSYYDGVRSVEKANEVVDKFFEWQKHVKKLVAKYGPCPKCKSKDIEPVSYTEGQHQCRRCGHKWHRETKDPWEYYELKQDAAKMGLKLEIGDGNAKITQEDVAEVMERIAKAKEKEEPLPKTMRSTRVLEALLAPFITDGRIYMFRVEGENIQIKLVQDSGMRFSARRHDYRTGEITQVRPLGMWDQEENKTNPQRVKKFMESLELE